MKPYAIVVFAALLVAAAPHTPAPHAAPLRPASMRPSPSAAAPKANAPGFNFMDWTVKTDQFDYSWGNGNFNAPTHITLTRPGSEIQADRASGNQKSKQATLVGNVVLHDTNGVLTNFAGQGSSRAPATLTCDRLTIDGVSKTYVAMGDVHFHQGRSEVVADRAVMNGITHDIHLYGSPGHPVQLTQ